WVQHRQRSLASVIENLLKLSRGFRGSPESQIGLTAQVWRPEFGGGFVARRGLQLFYRLRGIATVQLHRRAGRRQPDQVDHGILGVTPGQLVNEQLYPSGLTAQR